MSNRLAGLLAALLPIATLAASASVSAAEPRSSARIASPDARIAVEVTTDNEGRASYTVSRDGRPVIAASRLGLMFTDAPKLERNLAITAHRSSTHDARWEQPWGERRQMRDHHNELRVTLAETDGPARRRLLAGLGGGIAASGAVLWLATGSAIAALAFVLAAALGLVIALAAVFAPWPPVREAARSLPPPPAGLPRRRRGALAGGAVCRWPAPVQRPGRRRAVPHPGSERLGDGQTGRQG